MLVPDGCYTGLWSGHTLKWNYKGVEIQHETDLGVRGLNIHVSFYVRDSEVIEDTIRSTWNDLVQQIIKKDCK